MSIFSDNINSLNTTVNVHPPDKSAEILAWLSPLEQRIRHNDIRSCRVPAVGDWLLQTAEFRNWRGTSCQDKSTTLFSYGNPGVGKTYITSLVVDTLGDQANEKNIVVACFYFDFAARKEHSPITMLGALLRQVVSGLPEIPGEVVEAYNRHKRVAGGRGPQLSEILEMLQTVSASRRIFICVDALDECAVEHQQVVLESLQKILKKSPGTRLFLTARSHIRNEIRALLAGAAMFIEIKPNRGDIIRYILAKLEKDTNKDAMNARLKEDILTRIPPLVPGMFLLVSLIMESILKEQKISTRRERLKAMARRLTDAYDKMLSRVKAQGKIKEEIGMAALMWVSHSERPLKVDELCHALAVKIGSADLDPENVPSIKTLSDCCQGLLAVDKEASTVRLVHSTLRYHLSNHPDFVGRAHSAMAETCLTYLNFQQFKSLSTSELPDLIATPFLGYSSIYWGVHARRKLSDRAKLLALKLFNDYGDHISVKLLLKNALDPDDFSNIEGFSSFTGLHCASFFGIVEIVATLMGMDSCDVDQMDCVGNTPLMWAAQNGHERTAVLLRGRGDVTPSISCRSSHTPPLHSKRKRVDELPPQDPAPEKATGDLGSKRHKPPCGL